MEQCKCGIRNSGEIAGNRHLLIALSVARFRVNDCVAAWGAIHHKSSFSAGRTVTSSAPSALHSLDHIRPTIDRWVGPPKVFSLLGPEFCGTKRLPSSCPVTIVLLLSKPRALP